MENKVLADIFYEIADFLDIEPTKSSKFEIMAYKKAGLTIETLQEPIEDIYKKYGKKGLMSLPGIGSGLADKIEEFIKTGKIKKYNEFKKKYPIDLRQLTNIEGIGARKAILLYKKLGIRNIADLKRSIEQNKISKLQNFGPKSQDSIKRSIELLEKSKGRILLGAALPLAEQIVEQLKKSNLTDKIEISGSIRRMRETIGDIDILAVSNQSKKLMDFFSELNDVENIIVKGETKTTVWLKAGISCDLRVVKNKSFASALQYFTGNKEHNINIREIAISKNLKLNEYGLFDNKNKFIYCSNENDIYEKLGMQYMPPEMREDRGEIKLAQSHKIPKLVELKDLKGDLHVHTDDSDGENSLEEMAAAAQNNKLEYIAITNHTKSLKIANGLDEKRFSNLFERIDKLNQKIQESANKLILLKSAEVDILKNGTLDLDKKTLDQMDCVIGAVHSYFKMEKNEMTSRIIKAIESSNINILAHPTGRLINERPGYLLDIEKIFEACEKNNVILEINSFPNRLDLNDTNILLASKYNVMFSIDTDSHRAEHLKFLKYGTGTARRGWLAKEKIINSKSLDQLKQIFKK